MQSSVDRFRRSKYLLITLLSGLLVLISGCGGQNPDQPPGPPIPDSPRAYQGTGTPLRLFGSQNNRARPGADDPEYQEYLLWKEWKEYQRYQEFLQSQGQEGVNPEQSESQ